MTPEAAQAGPTAAVPRPFVLGPTYIFRCGIVAPLVTAVVVLLGRGVAPEARGASGMFPKMPAATNVVYVDCMADSRDARLSALALQGLVNQTSAEIYLLTSGHHEEQLAFAKKPRTRLHRPEGENGGLRALFHQYQTHVKKLFIYDPAKEWTLYLATMAGAQQGGIPVTESIRASLVDEFKWRGEVHDYRDKWANRAEAYRWALEKLMPGCSRKVVFALARDKPLFDYAVASKGFVFWLNFKDPAERTLVEQIFSTKGYGVGTSLMGYGSGGDDWNKVANKYGLGYVVSDYYSNGSYWSSFPNHVYRHPPGRPIGANRGVVYVALTWSDGDNIQFDQNRTYLNWRERSRGRVPVGTTLSPVLQELNSPLLDWYYTKMTANDELLAGPSGVQFIYGEDFNPDLFPAWCKLNKEWIAGAGFRSACVWHTPYPSAKYSSYIASCGLTGILHAHNGIGVRVDLGMPVMDEGHGAWKEEEIFDRLSKVKPDSNKPVFMGFKCIVEGFGDDGYAKINRQVTRLQTAFPGRFVFLLPKDLFATVRHYNRMPQVP